MPRRRQGEDSGPPDPPPQSAAPPPSSRSASDPPGSLGGGSSKRLMARIHDRDRARDAEERALRRKLVPRLAKRAYHLEDGNSWCQDWIQYQKNTHPVFGLCCYHRWHPVRLPQRVIILVGSIAFGFAVTNCAYLGFLSDESAGSAVNFVYDAAGTVAEVQERYTHVEVQQSVVFLLTVGSFLHSAFDMCVWYLMACFCCRPGGPCQRGDDAGTTKLRRACRSFGIYFAVLAVMIAIVAATFVAVVRLSQDQETLDESEGFAERLAADQLNDDASAPRSKAAIFAVGYLLELFFALFVFYFFTSTVFFSGILGCGRVPVLGGRPYEIWRKGRKEGGDEEDEEENGDGRGALSYV